MEDSLLQVIDQGLAQFVCEKTTSTTFQLRYRQQNSPKFKLTLQRSLSVQNLHIVLSQENLALTANPHSSLLRCFRINATSPGFYFVLNSSVLELHTDFRCGDSTTIGKAVDLMARWLITVAPTIVTESEQPPPTEPQRMGEVFQRVAENLHLSDYSLTVTDWRVRLWSTLSFKHEINLTLTLHLTWLEGSVSTTVEVAGNLQSHSAQLTPIASAELAHGRLKLSESVEFTEAHQVSLMLARTIASFFSTLAQAEEANMPIVTKEKEAIQKLLQAEYFDFGEYFLLLERLRAEGKVTTQPTMPTLGFPSGALVRFASDYLFKKAQDDYMEISTALRFHITPAQLSLVRISANRRSISLNTSGLVPVSALLRSSPSRLPALVSSLITALKLLKPTGLVVTRLKDAWYTRGSESILLPVWRGSQCSLAPGDIGNPELFAFAALRKWKLAREVTVKWEELMELFPIRPLSECAGGCKRKYLFTFSENAESRTSLLTCLEQIHWKVSSVQSICSLQSPPTSLALIYSRQNLTTRFCLVKKREIALNPLSAMEPKDNNQMLQEVGKALIKAHEAGVSHLMLSPDRIKVGSDGTIYVTGFKHNVCRIVEKYAKCSIDPSNCDFLDPAVLNYIHWKRVKSPASHSKKTKYLRYLDERCDVYSFAMLIYYCLSGNRPFSYVKNVDTYQGFLENVVAMHRKPLISQKFEQAHPEFTDVLRRSWEAAPLRPTLEELTSFLLFFSQYCKTPLIAKPYS